MTRVVLWSNSPGQSTIRLLYWISANVITNNYQCKSCQFTRNMKRTSWWRRARSWRWWWPRRAPARTQCPAGPWPRRVVPVSGGHRKAAYDAEHILTAVRLYAAVHSLHRLQLQGKKFKIQLVILFFIKYRTATDSSVIEILLFNKSVFIELRCIFNWKQSKNACHFIFVFIEYIQNLFQLKILYNMKETRFDKKFNPPNIDFFHLRILSVLLTSIGKIMFEEIH